MRAAVIPARGGSRRIPRKNIKKFYGVPIIGYSINTCTQSGLFDLVVVSTEDDEIAGIAKECGAEVLKRPACLAENHVGTQEVMRHAMERYPDVVEACCVYATVPMLHPRDLLDGYTLLGDLGVRYVLAVGTDPLRDAGMFYWGDAKSFLSGFPLISARSAMWPIPEHRICDINTPADWKRAEELYRELY